MTLMKPTAWMLACATMLLAVPAAAEGTSAAPKQAPRPIEVKIDIKGRVSRPNAVVEVNRIAPQAALTPLQKPLVERIEGTLQSGPF